MRGFMAASSFALGVLLLPATTVGAFAAAPTVTVDPATGNVTVTLENGTTVAVSAALASQIAAAMNAGDATAVANAIKALVVANAANDVNLATAIYILAINTTTDTGLRAAAYAGVVSGNPGAKTQVAANAPGGSESNTGGPGSDQQSADNGFPDGGTSGGGSTPSPNGP
jgi:hypothetical protein